MPRKTKEEFSEEPSEDENEDGMSDSPPSIDPYAVLGLSKESTADDVKKAYRKMALKHHPDKAPESDKAAANKKFQEIAFAYAVLSDERRRKRYDLTGSTAESIDVDEDFDWMDLYREQFANVVTEESINRLRDEYKGSAEERSDIVKAYKKTRGKLDKMFSMVLLSNVLEDDDRFRKIIDEEIKMGNLESYPAYERDNKDELREKAKAVERKRREAFDKKYGKDAAQKFQAERQEKRGKKNGDGGLGDLAALIQSRQKARMGPAFLDNLEAKYAQNGKKGRKRATPMDDEPSEEAFLATQKRLFGAKNAKKASKAREAKDDTDEDEDEDEDEDIILETDQDDDDDEDEEEEELTPPPKKQKRGTATKRGPAGKSRGRGRAKTKA